MKNSGEMSILSGKFTAKKLKDAKILANFINIFCKEKHKSHQKDRFVFKASSLDFNKLIKKNNLILCNDCRKLLAHSMVKLALCPYDPKPKCRKCKTHCYAPDYRLRIKEVMKFSGIYLLKRGRIDLLIM